MDMLFYYQGQCHQNRNVKSAIRYSFLMTLLLVIDDFITMHDIAATMMGTNMVNSLRCSFNFH